MQKLRHARKYTTKPKEAFRNEDGAIDLASIMVGIIVIGLIGGVIAATIFAVIPWTQDNAAKHQLDSIVTAEHAHMGLSSVTPPVLPESSRANSYADSVELEKANLLIQGPTYCVIETPDGKGYNAYSQSASGRVFTATEKQTKPVLFDGSLPAECASIADAFKNSSSTAPGSGSDPGSGSEPAPAPAPVGYVDPTPKLTKLTYRCDTTRSGFLPMHRALVGTETWNDGTTATYNGAENTTAKTLNAGVTYTVTFDGTYERFSFTDIHTCLRSVDHWGAQTGVINANNGFYGANNLESLPENIPTTITSMFGMFNKLNNFNIPAVSKWDVSNVTNMEFMFEGASAFNQPLNDWNVSKVTTMNNMLAGTTAFNQPLNKWDVSSVQNMRGLLGGASNFNQNINDWNVSNVTNMGSMLGAPKFNQPLDKWNTSKVTDMSSMFQGASAFNQPLNTWDVGAVTNMSAMFMSASAFNQNLTNWNTSNVTNMNFMFNLASSFNGQIGSWNTSKVTGMTYMFEKAGVFNQPIGNWNVSSVGNMSYMFQDSPAFNQPIGNWNVSNVDTMRAMFQSAAAFNQPLDSWNVSKVTNMRSMFSGAKAFNQPLNSWVTTSLTMTKYMFSGASAFNQPLNNWDVSKVSDMAYMFYDTTVFNQNLSGWNTAVLIAGGSFAPKATFTEGWQPPKTSLY